jgi:hypothetical protein
MEKILYPLPLTSMASFTPNKVQYVLKYAFFSKQLASQHLSMSCFTKEKLQISSKSVVSALVSVVSHIEKILKKRVLNILKWTLAH